MTDLLEPLAPTRHRAAGSPRLRARARRRRRCPRCSSRAAPTSGTSPASPARRRSLLVSADDALFVTDGRYRTQSAEQLGGGRRRRARSRSASRWPSSAQLLAAAVGRGCRGSASRITSSRGPSSASFAAAFEGVELVPAGTPGRRPAPGQGRRRGRPHPCRLCDRRRRVRSRSSRGSATGITERQFALELEFAMRERGASGNSFDPIIAAGPNGAKPHASPTRSRDRAQRARRVRLRLHRRRLLLRHDAHRVGRRSRCRRAPRLRRRARRVSRRDARSSPPMSRAPTSTARRATSSRTRVGPTRSRIRPGTASVSRSTKRRESPSTGP